MIKRAWLNQWGSELYSLSIRETAGTEHILIFRQDKFPPNEKVNGKKIGITEAIELGLAEPHTTSSLMSIDDLTKLRDAINEVLND